MAHVRQELALGPVGRLGGFLGPAEFVLHALALQHLFPQTGVGVREFGGALEHPHLQVQVRLVKSLVGDLHLGLSFLLPGDVGERQKGQRLAVRALHG